MCLIATAGFFYIEVILFVISQVDFCFDWESLLVFDPDFLFSFGIRYQKVSARPASVGSHPGVGWPGLYCYFLTAGGAPHRRGKGNNRDPKEGKMF